MIAHDKFAHQEQFDHQADHTRDHRGHHHGCKKRTRDLHGLGCDIRPSHVQRAMRHVQDIQNPKHQRQACRNQKQHQSKLQAIEQLLGNQSAAHRDTSCRTGRLTFCIRRRTRLGMNQTLYRLTCW